MAKGEAIRVAYQRVLTLPVNHAQVPALLMPDGFCITGQSIVLMIIASIAERRWIGS